MAGATQHTLTDDSLTAISRVVEFRHGLSRESVNNTPMPRMSVRGSVTPHATSWPVKVTGSSVSEGSDAGLYPGLAYVPDETDLWATHDCYLRALPGYTLKAGDAGLGRLIGWRPDATGGKPVYVLGAGNRGESGDGCPGCGFMAALTGEDCYTLAVDGGTTSPLTSGLTINGVEYTAVYSPSANPPA
ncbi:MAG TPA: hypothetical protein VGE74_12825, partial [Gemmata sp.]